MEALHFNTADARLFELNNHLTQLVQQQGSAPREVAVPLVLMTAPLAPHVAEELWERLGHTSSLAYDSFPIADPQWLTTDEVEIPVQVNGKVRARIVVPVDADEKLIEKVAREESRIAEALHGATVRKVVVVAGRMINFVIAPPDSTGN
jgi:leucyl-tRNA synthetase